MFRRAVVLGSSLVGICNVFLFAFLMYRLLVHGLAPAPPGWDYKDLVAILLTALGVILAALAIFIGGLAVFGYTAIRDAAVRAAVNEAVVKAARSYRGAEAVQSASGLGDEDERIIFEELTRKGGNGDDSPGH